jgi:hypothetical protein
MGGVLFHAGAATWLGNDHDLYAAPCFAYIDDSSDPRNAYPVRAENLDPGVLVVQSANQGMRHDASDPLNRARDWRILVQ